MKSRLRLIDNLWQGVVAADFTLDRVRQCCQHLATRLEAKKLSCLVASDTRFMSSLFAQDIYQYFATRGITVSLVPAPVPLPALQMALDANKAQCALVVSARNRPYWYNGLVLLETGAHDLSFTSVDEHASVQWSGAAGAFPNATNEDVSGQMFVAESTVDIRKPYLDMLGHHVDINLIRRGTLTIFTDPMHGTLAGYLPAVIGEGNQTKAIEINRETDPLFGKATPMPAATGVARLRKLVRESDSHIGLAFSADGTALGVVDKNGEMLDQLEVVLLLASYLVGQYRHKGIVIAPPPSAGSPLASSVSGISNWERLLGFKVELTSHATDRIKELSRSEHHNLLIGCTTEGEIIVGSYYPYPDAFIAGLLLLELVARNAGSLRTSLNDLRDILST